MIGMIICFFYGHNLMYLAIDNGRPWCQCCGRVFDQGEKP